MTQTLRNVTIKGKAIRKRCRNEERISFDVSGYSGEEAIEKMKLVLHDNLKDYRTYELSEVVSIYDVTSFNGLICRPLFPHIHPETRNYIEFKYDEEFSDIPRVK